MEAQPRSGLFCLCRKCVQEWEEPHDSALYCIRSDKNHMIASGSSYYGVVRLWDKRQTRCLQVRASQRPGSSRASEFFSSSPVPVSLWKEREGLLGCLWGKPTMGNLTICSEKPALLRHLGLWVCNTGWGLWADLFFERLIILFSCRAFTCLHPPAAQCTASVSVLPICTLP